jgi:predicted RNA-binding Zn-ribbon protein involved in translation (DUF1610 family)
MENARTIHRQEQAPRDAVCARCGAEAQWMFADSEQTRVEVICPDCGKYELPRAEFHHVESEIVEPEER